MGSRTRRKIEKSESEKHTFLFAYTSMRIPTISSYLLLIPLLLIVTFMFNDFTDYAYHARGHNMTYIPNIKQPPQDISTGISDYLPTRFSKCK